MGNTTRANQPRILIGGLDKAGKTTILYQMKIGKVLQTIPTIGFNIQHLVVDKNKVQVWDIGGSGNLLPLYQHYFKGMSGLIYVVDLSDDEDRLKISMDELWKKFMIFMDVKVPILIFGNKSDKGLNNFNKFGEGIQKLKGGRSVNFVACNGLTGQGVNEGMKWLVKQVVDKNFIQI